MGKYIYEKYEAINNLDDFKKYLKDGEDIKLKRTELACLKRYLHWLYDEEELVIVNFN